MTLQSNVFSNLQDDNPAKWTMIALHKRTYPMNCSESDDKEFVGFPVDDNVFPNNDAHDRQLF